MLLRRKFTLLGTLLVLALPASIALAVPAAPELLRLSQPDGLTFRARQWGDEFNHGWETQDGYSIIRDQYSQAWVYALPSSTGELMESSAIVGRSPPPTGLARGLKPASAAMAQQRVERMEALDVAAVQPAIALNGTANVLTILVNYQDRTTSYSPANFTNMLFGTGNNSMKDFYTENSHGLFTVSAGPGGIAGWYQAASGHDYYGANVNGNDAWPGDLVYEAVRAADTAGFNFAPYDQDRDCQVDVVNIVHQGTGEESGAAATDIWSHSWDLDSARYWNNSHFGSYTTRSACAVGGFVRVNRYVIQPELYAGAMSTVGVFAHEYGHALGLPDLYDTDGNSEGVGNWSLMAGGSWNGVTRSGDRPAHLDAWSKTKLSWLTPTQITSPSPSSVTINPAYLAASAYQFRSGSAASGTGEYFLVENRQRGGFDAGLPGSGLLVWHIDEAKTNNTGQCIPSGSSCSTVHYKVALVQADNLWNLERDQNRGDAGDPFPGSAVRTAFSGTTTPNSLLYNGSASGAAISNIALSGLNMTAQMSIGAAVVVPSAPSNLRATAVSTTQVTLAWQDNSSNETGFYLERKTGSAGTWSQIASLGANVVSYSNTGLTAGTSYYYRLRAYNAGGSSSNSSELNVVTSSACSSSTTAISVGGSLGGTLASTDCRSTVRTTSYYDSFTFAATAGTPYTITMNSTAFDAYLYLLNGSTVLAYDDDSNGNNNAKIVYTPTTSGTLTIHAVSYSANATGAYSVALSAPSSCSSSTTVIGAGASLGGTLATSDCRSSVRTTSYYDSFTFVATAGARYTITMNSTAFDAYLYLLNGSTVVAYDDDSNGAANARIVYTAPSSGTLTIHATSYFSSATGAYTVTRN